MDEAEGTTPPLLRDKEHGQPSVFQPANMLREARRQKGLPDVAVPAVCILDPDGDLVRQLRARGRARRHPGWACYHTELVEVEHGGVHLGIVGCAVAPPSPCWWARSCSRPAATSSSA